MFFFFLMFGMETKMSFYSKWVFQSNKFKKKEEEKTIGTREVRIEKKKKQNK